MTNNTNAEFHKLFYKVATNTFSIDYVKEVQSFSSKFSGSLSFEEVESKCKNLISQIYFTNNMDHLSLQMDLALLQSPSPYLDEQTIILRAMRTSVELNRTNDIQPYVNLSLEDYKVDWSFKLPMLAWSMKCYPTQQEDISAKYELLLLHISESIAIQVDRSRPFSEQVNYVHNEYKRGSKDLHAFHIAHAKAPLEQKERLIAEYLQKEQVGFYRTQVIEMYQNK